MFNPYFTNIMIVPFQFMSSSYVFGPLHRHRHRIQSDEVHNNVLLWGNDQIWLKFNLLPSRPERPVPSPDMQDSNINGLQRPYDDVVQNYRTNDPPRRFISGPHKMEKPYAGGPAEGPQTQEGLHDPVLTHSGLQGPLIQDLNMVALQQQQQEGTREDQELLRHRQCQHQRSYIT